MDRITQSQLDIYESLPDKLKETLGFFVIGKDTDTLSFSTLTHLNIAVARIRALIIEQCPGLLEPILFDFIVPAYGRIKENLPQPAEV